MDFSTSTTFELSPIAQAEVVTAPPPTGAPGQPFVPAFYVNAGSSVSFKLARSTVPARYQWCLNHHPIDGAVGSSLDLAKVGTVAAGTYTVKVEALGTRCVVEVATLTVVTDARFTHFAVRHHSDVPGDQLVVGCFIGGAGSKRVLLRSDAAEIVLAGWGGEVLASSQSGDLATSIAAVSVRPEGGWMPLSPMNAVLEQELETGGYSALVSRPVGATGTTALEVFDADPVSPNTAFANVSGRGRVGAGAAPLAIDFKVAGTAAATVLVRGVGPGLKSLFGLEDALVKTHLRVRDADGHVLSSNSGWGGTAALGAAFAQAGAFALPAISHDSALVLTLAPGAYTAELSGRDAEEGVGLIEVYEVPPP